VASIRQHGWSGAVLLPTSHGTVTIQEFLERYQHSAVSRGLRPRSIADISKCLRRVAREIEARRLADLTPAALQGWIGECGLKPVRLQSVVKNAACAFSKPSLQALGMGEVQNPFLHLVRPKVDREPFRAPPRAWITGLMRQGIKELQGEVRLAFVLGLGAGLRWGEISSLTWEEVQGGCIGVAAAKAKGRRARSVPIGPKIRAVVESGRGRGPVIAGDAEEVHATLCAWLRGCGVQDAKPVHYLRKCFGSLAVADHGIFIASKLLGHASIGITASTYAGQVDRLPALRF